MTRAEIAAYAHLPEWVVQFAQERGELQSGECSQVTVDGWLRFRAERAALIVRSLAPGTDGGGGGGQAIPPVRGYVYFFCMSDLAMVKIGWSAHPVQRLRGLQTAHATPLIVLGVVPGTLGEEAAWHQRWEPLRLRGEWFRLTSDLRDAIVAATTRAIHAAIDSQHDSPHR